VRESENNAEKDAAAATSQTLKVPPVKTDKGKEKDKAGQKRSRVQRLQKKNFF